MGAHQPQFKASPILLCLRSRRRGGAQPPKQCTMDHLFECSTAVQTLDISMIEATRLDQ